MCCGQPFSVRRNPSLSPRTRSLPLRRAALPRPPPGYKPVSKNREAVCILLTPLPLSPAPRCAWRRRSEHVQARRFTCGVFSAGGRSPDNIERVPGLT